MATPTAHPNQDLPPVASSLSTSTAAGTEETGTGGTQRGAITTPATIRRTRIVCISDTHNCTVKVPAGDVLIHSGDLTNTGSLKELQKQIEWLARQPHEVKIIVVGNHDTTVDAAFYAEHGAYFHHGQLQDVQACRDLLLQPPSVPEHKQQQQQHKHQQWIYLEHEARTVRLTSPNGPRTEFTVFGSPWTPQFESWAFQYTRHQEDDGLAASRVWNDIPLDTDVLITHGPSFGHRDETVGREAAGCEELRRAMWRVRPRLAVCGHIHEARGVERVRWDLEDRGVRYKEEVGGIEAWVDPAPEGDKVCLVDLTGKKQGRALDNDGGKATMPEKKHLESQVPRSEETGGDATPVPAATAAAEPGIGTRGLGGDPASARSDQAALAGRMGRRETCIVNAAIQASGYPHVGPRRLNKAIVVDLDLPVWGEAEGA
ncbi:Metallo-dependent phosphatase-like protein [Apiospora arundinis]|uniref:Metallo-dependent phosphatase-like protein n=1 Tax=Apiospora arundinis TaxID=335852 RepID=A0ABR2I837_9PEZI